jgi:hypothetical protein
MREFIADDEIPPYAILSHTWAEDEVSLLDMERPDVSQKNGLRRSSFAMTRLPLRALSGPGLIRTYNFYALSMKAREWYLR